MPWLVVFAIAVAFADPSDVRALPNGKVGMSPAKRLATGDAVRAELDEVETAYANGDFARAEPLVWDAAERSIRAFGDVSPLTCRALNDLGLILDGIGDVDTAGVVLKRNLDAHVAVYGPVGSETALAWFNLGAHDGSSGDDEAARHDFEQAMGIARVTDGENAESTVQYATQLAVVVGTLGDEYHEQALEVWCLDVQERTGRFRTLTTAQCAINLGQFMLAHGDSVDGRIRIEQGEAIAEAILGPDSAELARFLRALGRARLNDGRLEDAWDLADRAIALEEKAGSPSIESYGLRSTVSVQLGRSDVADVQRIAELAGGRVTPELVAAVIDRAHALGEAGRIADAVASLEAIRPGAEAAFPSSHPAIVGLWGALAVAYDDAGRYRDALPLQRAAYDGMVARMGASSPLTTRQALDLTLEEYRVGDAGKADIDAAVAACEAAMGPTDPEMGHVLNVAGVTAWQSGDFPAAEAFLRRALELQEALLGADHPEVIETVGNLARVTADRGHYDVSAKLYDRVLRSSEATYGIDSPRLAVFYENFALLRLEMGDSDGAVDYSKRALALREAGSGSDSVGARTSRIVLGSTLAAVGRGAEAEKLLRAALADQEATVGPDDADVAYTLMSLGDAVAAQDRFADARPFYLRALDILVARKGPDVLDCAPVLAALSDNARVLKLPDAEDWFARGEALAAKYPEEQDLLIDLTRGHAQLEDDLGDRKRSIELATQALDLADAQIDVLIDSVSDRERIALVASRRSILDLYLSLAGPDELPRAWVEAVRWQGLATRALQHLRASGAETGDVAALRRQIASLAFERDATLRQARLTELSAMKERAERADAARIGAGGLADASAKDVCGAIPPDAALVLFDRYDYISNSSVQPMYLAFIAQHTDAGCQVENVQLGSADAIDAAIERWRSLMTSAGMTSRVDAQGAALRKLIWDPIAAAAPQETVWIVPDGAIATVPFAGLPTASHRYLLQDRAIGYLDTAMDVLRPFERDVNGGALVVGNVEFGAEESEAGECMSAFRPLPATKPEAVAVSAALTSAGVPVDDLTGVDATEAGVRQAAAGRRVVHLATHGFFAGDSCEPAVADARSVQMGIQDNVVVGYDPMVLSGLALAGANTRDDAGGDDGLWTAEEVSSLDLRGTDLVVLSACDTGLGRRSNGEGVLGLRRAFDVAGADGLVMSLWEVEDQATSSLMTHFYAELLAPGAPPASVALRRAQQAVLAEQFDATGQARPWAWAAFVAAGPGAVR